MFHSKTLTLFLLGLTWSIGCLPADAARVRSPHIRGRGLQETTSSEDIPSADAEPVKAESAPKTAKGIMARSIGPDARECITKQDKDNVEFECKSVTENGSSQVKDTLSYKVGASKGDHLKITVEYATKWESMPADQAEMAPPTNETEPMAGASNETAPSSGRALQNENTTDSENRTKYTLVYDRLIEYRKNGTASDGHYEWGIDQIVAEYPLDKWDALSPVQNNSNLLTFSATVGIASFNFTISQSDATSISTNKMKIDFLLENYPWADTNDTYIALISHIETERRTRTGRAGPGSDRISEVVVDFDEATQTLGYVPFGQYTWASTAEATVSATAVGDVNGTVFNATGFNGTAVETERSAEYNSTDAFGNFTGAGNFTAAATSGNFSDGTVGNFTANTRTATISVVASSSNRTDPGPRGHGPGHDNVAFQEIAFSFVGAGKGSQRIFWDPEAGVGYSASPARMVGSLVLLASSMVVALLL